MRHRAHLVVTVPFTFVLIMFGVMALAAQHQPPQARRMLPADLVTQINAGRVTALVISRGEYVKATLRDGDEQVLVTMNANVRDPLPHLRAIGADPDALSRVSVAYQRSGAEMPRGFVIAVSILVGVLSFLWLKFRLGDRDPRKPKQKRGSKRKRVVEGG